MLRGVHPLLTADLLHALASMGHGDEIVIVDANFPAISVGRRLVALPGADAPRALAAILTVFPLDTFVPPAVFTMQSSGRQKAVPAPVAAFRRCSPSMAANATRGSLDAAGVLRARAQRVRRRSHRRAAAVRQRRSWSKAW